MASVSVIVPNYNHADYLRERLNSILNQTALFNELVILDDASTDDSLRIINECLKDIPHQCIVNPSNSGSTFRQWRKGVSHSNSDLIWIAESDDAAESTFLEQCLAQFNANPALGLVFTNSRNIDCRGKRTNLSSDYLHLYLPGQPLSKPFLMDGVNAIEKHLIFRNIVMNASAAVFRRDMFLRHSNNLENFRFSGDWLLWLRIAQEAPIAYLNEPLNLFRQHGEKVTSTAALDGTLERENFRILREMRADPRLSPASISRSEKLVLNELIQPESPSGSRLNSWQRLLLMLDLCRIQPRTSLHLVQLAIDNLLPSRPRAKEWLKKIGRNIKSR